VTTPPRLEHLLLDHPAADDDALVHTLTASVTKRDVVTRAQRLAANLRAAAVSPGTPVAVQMPNSPDLVAAMFGVWIAGAVFVPVNHRAPDAEVAKVVAGAGAGAVVTRLDAVERVEEPVRVHDPDVALVLFTSGTTGEPKAVLHGHEAYLQIVDRALRGIAANRRDGPAMPNLVPVSLALNAGIYNLLFGFRAGAAVVLMDRFVSDEFATLVARFGIRSTVLPPAALVMLADDATITTLEPLRYVRSITAPLSPPQARRFMDRFGVAVLNSYGQTEIGEVIGWTAADAREHPEKLGAAGRPHAGVDLRIDEAGELWVRPPHMTLGYASGAELSDRVDDDGFLRTGDLARIDDDGFVWIEGRASDLVNRGGNKIVPGEVEAVLAAVPGVADVAVAGVPDERLGQVPVAFVVPRDLAAPPTADVLEQACRAVLVPYKVPARFVIVDALPRNEIGKVLRSELVSRAL
jgi:long-chain acyl-CoA synthetase